MKNKTVYTCTDGCGGIRYSCDPNDLDDRFANESAPHFKSRTLYKIHYGSFLVSCLGPGVLFNKHSQRYVSARGLPVALGLAGPTDVRIVDDAEAALNWLVNE